MSVNAVANNEDLKVLVQELSKPNPDAGLIKKKTDNLGIPYSTDFIILMSEVLVYLSRAGTITKMRMKEKPAWMKIAIRIY